MQSDRFIRINKKWTEVVVYKCERCQKDLFHLFESMIYSREFEAEEIVQNIHDHCSRGHFLIRDCLHMVKFSKKLTSSYKFVIFFELLKTLDASLLFRDERIDDWKKIAKHVHQILTRVISQIDEGNDTVYGMHIEAVKVIPISIIVEWKIKLNGNRYGITLEHFLEEWMVGVCFVFDHMHTQ
eukprot:TRINITY_DN5161_c0_g1_i2.p1 TRINITY_DN5161_c0_g1~~TRINITY_DN5161_c0_g1_i2.p1  ORF type:complete len:183 (-),score=22.10 TRINITY_DN5161_c0_g1_i2:53-601(-)